MPCTIRTAQLNQGWSPEQFNEVVNNLFAASGWGTPTAIERSVGDPNPMYELDSWHGAKLYYFHGTDANFIRLSLYAGVNKSYRVTGSNPSPNYWLRDELRWDYQNVASSNQILLSQSAADPIYMFTLTGDNLRWFSIQHRNAYRGAGWGSLENIPPVWTDKINLGLFSEVTMGSWYSLYGMSPGGVVRRPDSWDQPQEYASQSQYDHANNRWQTDVAGETNHSRMPYSPYAVFVGNTKRQGVRHVPVTSGQIFSGYLPLDIYMVAYDGLQPWAQLRTEDNKLLQLVGGASSQIAVWINE